MSDKGIKIAVMKPGDVCLGYSINPVSGEVIVTIQRADGSRTDEIYRLPSAAPIDPKDEAYAVYYGIPSGLKA